MQEDTTDDPRDLVVQKAGEASNCPRGTAEKLAIGLQAGDVSQSAQVARTG